MINKNNIGCYNYNEKKTLDNYTHQVWGNFSNHYTMDSYKKLPINKCTYFCKSDYYITSHYMVKGVL